MTTTKISSIRSSRGYTLVEMTIVGLLVSVAGLMAASAFLLLGKTATYVRSSADAEVNAYTLASMLPVYLGQAVEVDWTAGGIPADLGAGRGRLRRYTSALSNSATPPTPIPIGLYLREEGRPSDGLDGSEIRATGIYFREPTRTSPGELFIASSDRGTGQAVLSPDLALERFSSIVEFSIEPAGFNVAMNQPVRVARVRVVYRKYMDGGSNDWRWCPASQSSDPTCRSPFSSRDIERVLNIPLPNNAIETNLRDSSGAFRRETIFGDLYFFRMGLTQ